MNVADIPSLLEQMSGAHIVVIGDAMLDQYVYGSTDRVSREAPVPVVRYEREEHRLGGAGNAARNVTALGGSVKMVTVAGQDEQGQALIESLRGAGAETQGVVRETGRQTLTKLRVLAGAQGTGKQQVLRMDRLPAAAPTKQTRARLHSRLQQAIRECGCVLVSDYGGGSVDTSTIRLLARHAAKLPVLVDSRYALGQYAGPFLLKPNATELTAATGLDADDDRSVVRAARLLLERCGSRAVLTTRGRRGMTLVQPAGRPVHLPIFGGDDVTDVTGAGDTVAAAIALGIAAGASVSQAMAVATVAAGLVVQKLGAATVSPAEICAAIAAGGAA